MNDFDKALTKLKKFGEDFSRVASDRIEIDTIGTGISDLDKHVLGVGGIPVGRIIELIGSESSGKSTLAEHIIAKIQTEGKIAVLFDLEGRYDRKWGAKAGIDNDKLITPSVSWGEEVFDQIISLIDTVDFIMLDSLAALESKESMVKGMDESVGLALDARMNTKGFKAIVNGKIDGKGNRIVKRLNESKTTIIIINQLRDNVGVMYGPKTRTTGGRALKHYASIRLEMSNPRYEKDGEYHKQKVRVKCIKNSLAPPLRECEFYLTNNNEIIQDKASVILNEAIEKGIIERRKAWLYHDDFPEGKIQGLNKFEEWLNDNPEFEEKIK